MTEPAESLDDAVLRVLQGQSLNYFIYPNAAAFAAEGLDAEQVAQKLAELHEAGALDRELVTITVGYDVDGEPITDQIAGGYQLSGRTGSSGRDDPLGI